MKIIYFGRVQGVGFRYFIHLTALKYQIFGSVKNLSNGNVQLLINDNCKNINVFLRRIRDGNGYSKITKEEKSVFLCDDNTFTIKDGG